jgi:hypothetical protein
LNRPAHADGRRRRLLPSPGLALALALVLASVGLITACSSVDLGDPPADVNACRPSQQFFIDEIWPNVLAKDYGGRHCYDASCHDGGKALSIPPPPATSVAMIPLPSDWAANYLSASENMQCSNVQSSPLLANPSGLVTHGGGKLFEPTGPEAKLLEMWVTVTP